MKNKLIICILVILLCGCGNYRELNDMAIVTGISINKIDDNYELGILIANSPKAQTTNKEGEAQTTVYSAKGKTVMQAMQNIDYKSPEKLYLGHINVIIISEKIGRDGFFKVADYFLRSVESRKRFFLMQTKDDDPKDILKIISPLESFPSQSIATLLKSNQEAQSVVETVDYSTFVGRILEKGYDPLLPVITISGNSKKGSKSKNLESTEPAAYLKLDSVAIYRNDKFVGYEKFKYSQAVSMINNNITEFKTIFKYNNHDIGFNSETMKSKIKVKDLNEINIMITGRGNIAEINAGDDLENPKIVKKIEKNLNKSIKKTLTKTVKKMQKEYQTDVFGFGNKIYKKYPKQWLKLEKNWNSKYFPKLKVNIKVNITINSTGALDRTIMEVQN